jgi:glycosyltransferase involved in cell wall biosynthesis
MIKNFFSIVTAVLNGEKYIEETILSIKNQSFKKFQYIIVDGGSTDNTHKIINKYKKYINKIIISKDKTMYEALAKGFHHANGKYYLWINSDDYLFNENSLKNLNKFLIKKPYQWIVGRTVIRKNDTIRNYIPLIYPRFILKYGFAHSCAWGFVQQENTIFSSELYKKSSGINVNYKQAGDFYLWKDFANYEKLKSINLPITVQRKWSNQMTQRYKDVYFKELKIKKCIFNIFYPIRIIYSFFLFPLFFFRK